MNSFSWLIYSADAFSEFGSTLRVVCGLGLAGFFIWMALPFRFMLADMSDEKPPAINMKIPAIFLVGLLLGTLVPSKQTIYLIAASEMGEHAIKTEMASDVFEIVKKEIKKMKEAK